MTYILLCCVLSNQPTDTHFSDRPSHTLSHTFSTGTLVLVMLIGMVHFLKLDKAERHAMVYMREYNVKVARKEIEEDLLSGMSISYFFLLFAICITLAINTPSREALV